MVLCKNCKFWNWNSQNIPVGATREGTNYHGVYPNGTVEIVQVVVRDEDTWGSCYLADTYMNTPNPESLAIAVGGEGAGLDTSPNFGCVQGVEK